MLCTSIRPSGFDVVRVTCCDGRGTLPAGVWTLQYRLMLRLEHGVRFLTPPLSATNQRAVYTADPTVCVLSCHSLFILTPLSRTWKNIPVQNCLPTPYMFILTENAWYTPKICSEYHVCWSCELITISVFGFHILALLWRNQGWSRRRVVFIQRLGGRY